MSDKNEAAEALIERVLALHKPLPIMVTVNGCDRDGVYVETDIYYCTCGAGQYPCETRRVLDPDAGPPWRTVKRLPWTSADPSSAAPVRSGVGS